MRPRAGRRSRGLPRPGANAVNAPSQALRIEKLRPSAECQGCGGQQRVIPVENDDGA